MYIVDSDQYVYSRYWSVCILWIVIDMYIVDSDQYVVINMYIFHKYYVFIVDVKMKTAEIIVGIEETDNNW